VDAIGRQRHDERAGTPGEAHREPRSAVDDSGVRRLASDHEEADAGGIVKKIDLHIHTVPTVRDASFEFSLAKLVEYVSNSRLDAIAITNHDCFDRAQFETVRDSVNAVVFPGIEVSLECGHVLVIAACDALDTFEEKADRLHERVATPLDTISLDDFERIFGDLRSYLVIPHYEKSPAVTGASLDRISQYACSGEVDSAKKFIRATKNDAGLTPVLFSDARIAIGLHDLPTRHTFVDCGELTLRALKSSLQDKRKVALSENDGNALVQVFDDGQMISTGLNVLMGSRSSGKSFTLDRIDTSHDNVKYIKQFSLVQQDSQADQREFDRGLDRDRSLFTEEYLRGFKAVLNDVMRVDLAANDRAVADYVSTLLRSADEADRQDAYSKTALFDESEFPQSDDELLSQLIGSTRQLIENLKYRDVIERYIDRNALKRLALDLIKTLWERADDRKRKTVVNALVADIKKALKMRTSATQVSDVDLYQVSLDAKKVARFSRIVRVLETAAVIREDEIQGFKVIAKKGPYGGAGEIKSVSGVVAAFRDAFNEYDRPYQYLQQLLEIEPLKQSELYKLFAKISYSILNADGFEISGGERSEFRLLREIADAQNYDFLLVDEPESSFDNIFLRSDVNEVIRAIAAYMPVVVVTHNSTVGASIHPDYVLYASKEPDGDNVVYRLYSGYPTDHELESCDGRRVQNYEVMLNSLEAGREAYEDRRQGYEALDD